MPRAPPPPCVFFISFFPPPRCDPPQSTHATPGRLWTTTLGSAEEGSGGAPFYIKPAEDAKAFNGEEATPAELAALRRRFPPNFPVACSESVDVACEYRVYVARGAIKAVAHCPHPGCEKAALDMDVVRAAVATLEGSGEALGGYGIDFCVIKKDGGVLVTALMEVNDGAMCGVYDGVTAEDYTEMVEARWQQLRARRLFCYGTLMTGFGNNKLLGGGDPASMLLGRARTMEPYAMFAAGVPFVNSTLPRTRVAGEVWAVGDPAVLARIDKLEGHPDWYQRRPVEVEMESGQRVTAELYFCDAVSDEPGNAFAGDAVCVPSGDFRDVTMKTGGGKGGAP